MKQIIVVILIQMLIATALADVEIKEGKDGWLWAKYDGPNTSEQWYIVDTATQLCMLERISTYGLQSEVIPCEKLALREEWKAHLTWITGE